MARKSSRTANASVGAKSFSPTIANCVHERRSPRQSRIDHSGNDGMTGLAQITTQTDRVGGSCDCSSSSDGDAGDEAGDEAGESDTAEADDEDEDDEDGDAPAPSGHATKVGGNQAGHHITHGEMQKSHEPTDAGRSTNSSLSHVSAESSRQDMTAARPGANDSDDEAYNGVDEITGSEGGERETYDCETCDSETYDTDMFYGLEYEYSDPIDPDRDGGLFQNASIFQSFDSMPSLPEPASTPTRRVHFSLPVGPRSASSDIVSDDMDLNGLFESSARSGAEPAHVSSMVREDDEMDGDEDFGGNSSGYETDYGSTTDEEYVPRYATTRPQILTCQPSMMMTDPSATGITPPLGPSGASTPSKVPVPSPRRSAGPRLGSFKVNPTKPYGMLDCTGDNIMMTPAKRAPRADEMAGRVISTRVSTANASPIAGQMTLYDGLVDGEIDFSNIPYQGAADPILALGSQSMADNVSPNGQMASPNAPESVFFENMLDYNALEAAITANVEDDDDEDLDINDFIYVSSDTSEDEHETLGTVLPTPNSTSPTVAFCQIQPRTPSPKGSSKNDLMAHSEKGVNGHFRKGKSAHQQSSHRSHNGPSLSHQTLKSGRHPPANSPISPPKKRKMSGSFAPATSNGPFAKKRSVHHR